MERADGAAPTRSPEFAGVLSLSPQFEPPRHHFFFFREINSRVSLRWIPLSPKTQPPMNKVAALFCSINASTAEMVPTF